jgi:hypothetical protein
MDWVWHHNIYLPEGAFMCVEESKDNQVPTVIQVYNDVGEQKRSQDVCTFVAPQPYDRCNAHELQYPLAQKIKLDGPQKWDKWFEVSS